MSRKIRSRDNAAFKQLLRITASARERRQLGVSFIEGIHLCDSYLRRFGPPRQVVHTEAALLHARGQCGHEDDRIGTLRLRIRAQRMAQTIGQQWREVQGVVKFKLQ